MEHGVIWGSLGEEETKTESPMMGSCRTVPKEEQMMAEVIRAFSALLASGSSGCEFGGVWCAVSHQTGRAGISRPVWADAIVFLSNAIVVLVIDVPDW